MNYSSDEQRARTLLSKKYQKHLKPETVWLGIKSRGKGHRFDLVNSTKRGKYIVIGEIKSCPLGSAEGYTSKRKLSLIEDCVYLEKVRAKRKLLAFTHRDLLQKFAADMQGWVDKNIEFVYVDLERGKVIAAG